MSEGSKGFSFRIRGIDFFLELERDRAHLRALPTEEIVEVSPEEAEHILNLRREDLLDKKLQLRGIYLDEESRNSTLSGEVAFIRSNLPQECLLVMLDTTTVRDALHCLEYRNLTPLNLLDLGVLCFAAICFDRIVIQPGYHLQSINEHPDIFSIITYPDGFIPRTLWSICCDVSEDLPDRVDEMEAGFEKAWCRFLSLDPGEIKLNLQAWDQYQNSPAYWNGVMASHSSSDLFGQSPPHGGDKRERDDFLSIQTNRVLFNDKLAGFLGLPYLASSIRSCVHSQVIAKKVETRLLVDRLISSIGPRPAESYKEYPYVPECSAPFLLGLVLEQMRTPRDFFPVLKTYRERFAPLRRKIWEDREMWTGGSGSYLEQFLKHLNGGVSEYIKRTEDVIEGSASVATSLVTATKSDAGLAKLGIKLLRLLNPGEKIYHLYLKYFKPEVYLLFSLVNEAKRLHMAEERVRSIWGRSWTRKEHEQLEFLAASHPGEFLRLRKLE